MKSYIFLLENINIVTNTAKASELISLAWLNIKRITPKEYAMINHELNAGFTDNLAQFIAQITGRSVLLSRGWETGIESAVMFYETAKRRDEVLKKRLEEWSQDIKDKSGVSILVYGGFHKEAIKAILQTNNISYSIVTPKMTLMDKKRQAQYHDRMSLGANLLSAPMSQATQALTDLEVAALNQKYATYFEKDLRQLQTIATVDPIVKTISLRI
jgi:hypothetical protein